MFDHRIGAMIAVSLLIASPALVFADAEQFRGEILPHVNGYQLTSTTPSTVETALPHRMAIDERESGRRWDGVDFPVGGKDQFARAQSAPEQQFQRAF